MTRFFFLSLGFFLVSSVGLTAESNQNLLTVRRSDDSSFKNLITLDLDMDGNVIALQQSAKGGNSIAIEDLLKNEIKDKKERPKTLSLMDSYIKIRRADDQFSAASGGDLILEYYYSPFEYKLFRMSLIREGGRWLLRDENHQEFSDLVVKLKKLPLPGIEKLIPRSVDKSVDVQSFMDKIQTRLFGSAHPSEFDGNLFRLKSIARGILVRLDFDQAPVAIRAVS